MELHPQGNGQAEEALFPATAEHPVSGEVRHNVLDGAEYRARARGGQTIPARMLRATATTEVSLENFAPQ